jgi:hypothetical protein
MFEHTDVGPEAMFLAELQWAVQVKCVNALLAEIKVGEKGELIIVNAPGRNFGPSEFDKLIEGLQVARQIAERNRKACGRTRPLTASRTHKEKSRGRVEVLRSRSLYKVKYLKTG